MLADLLAALISAGCLGTLGAFEAYLGFLGENVTIAVWLFEALSLVLS